MKKIAPRDNSNFLSYANEDADFALQLAADLSKADTPAWIDKLYIKPGDHWDTVLEAALDLASTVIVVLSKASVKSKNVLDEIGFALDEGKQLIPILYEKCRIPLRVRRTQYIDFTTNYEAALTLLVQSLREK